MFEMPTNSMLPNNSDKINTEISRTEKRAIKQNIETLARRFRKDMEINEIPVTFDNKNVISCANFVHIANFMKAINLKGIIGKSLSFVDAPNVRYKSVDILETIINSGIMGKTPFTHMAGMNFDPGYLAIMELNKIPTEGTFRNFFDKFDSANILDLDRILRRINATSAALDMPRQVWLDIDDSVLTVFGNQEKSAVGYNPRYHGRSSYKTKLCHCSKTGEVVHIDLYPGDVHSNGELEPFIDAAKKNVPANYVIKGFRLDCGHYSEDNCKLFESETELYLIKTRMSRPLKNICERIEERKWKRINHEYSICEMEYRPQSWEKPRRHILIRSTVEKDRNKTGQLQLFYEYDAIVTNIEYSDMNMISVWQLYNQRGNCELEIKELKYGYDIDTNSQSSFAKNRAYLKIKAIEYNIVNFWRNETFPNKQRNQTIETVRREIINIAGNVCGSGRYMHISIAPNVKLEKMITTIKEKFAKFIQKIVLLIHRALSCFVWVNIRATITLDN